MEEAESNPVVFDTNSCEFVDFAPLFTMYQRWVHQGR